MDIVVVGAMYDKRNVLVQEGLDKTALTSDKGRRSDFSAFDMSRRVHHDRGLESSYVSPSCELQYRLRAANDTESKCELRKRQSQNIPVTSASDRSTTN